MKKFLICLLLLQSYAFAQKKNAKDLQVNLSGSEIECFNHIEISLILKKPPLGNPFTDVSITGTFTTPANDTVTIKGFCDSPDGKTMKVRFMPKEAGKYQFHMDYKSDKITRQVEGEFNAIKTNNKGGVRVDKEYPWHFVYEGTGEHYFWHGTTTYWLLGWEDETIIHRAIDRLAALKVNRLRVALNGRVVDGNTWYEPMVLSTENFKFRLNPWLAKYPDALEKPEFEVNRFNVAFWQKADRMIEHARSKNVVISVIFYLDGSRPGVDPFGRENEGCENEKRYYQYAVSRFGAYANIMWDLSNEYRNLRSDKWCNEMGNFMKQIDVNQHLISTHGHEDFRFLNSSWADFAMYQQWDNAGGYTFMSNNRKIQQCSGKIMPQVNEEYGYEDHYPMWGGEGARAPARSAENRCLLAWEMAMAGCYQTTGERADKGVGAGDDTGGGWISGRNDANSNTMLTLWPI